MGSAVPLAIPAMLLLLGFSEPGNALLQLSQQNPQSNADIMLRVDTPWENLVMQGPDLVWSIGRLMALFSLSKDFSLIEANSTANFTYIRKPESFRATVLQIANDGWSAFHVAQKSMDIIRLSMQILPSHIDSVERGINGPTVRYIKNIVSRYLKKLLTTGHEYAKAVAEAEQAFEDYILILQEILDATTASALNISVADIEPEDDKTGQELAKADKQRESVEQYENKLKMRQQKIDKEIKKYITVYQEAMKRIPAGFEALALDIVRPVITLSNILSISPAFKSIKGDNLKMASLIAIMQHFGDQIGKINDTARETFDSSRNMSNIIGRIYSHNVVLEAFKKLVQGLHFGENGRKTKEWIQSGMQLCNLVIQIFERDDKNAHHNQIYQILSEFDVLYEKVKVITATSAYLTRGISVYDAQTSGNEIYKAYLNLVLLQDNQNRLMNEPEILTNSIKTTAVPVTDEPENFSTVLPENETETNEADSAVTTVTNETEPQVQTNETVLAETTVFTNDTEPHVQINGTDSNVTMVTKEAELQKAFKLIKDVVSSAVDIRDHLNKFGRFYAKAFVRTTMTLNQTLDNFLAILGGENGMVTQEERDLLTYTLKQQTAEFVEISSFLQIVSNVYTQVGDKYLLDRLAGLAKILTAKTEFEQQSLLDTLMNDTDNAKSRIKVGAEKRRNIFQDLMQSRIEEVSNLLKDIGGQTANEREAAEEGINNAKDMENHGEVLVVE